MQRVASRPVHVRGGLLCHSSRRHRQPVELPPLLHPRDSEPAEGGILTSPTEGRRGSKRIRTSDLLIGNQIHLADPREIKSFHEYASAKMIGGRASPPATTLDTPCRVRDT